MWKVFKFPYMVILGKQGLFTVFLQADSYWFARANYKIFRKISS